MTMACISAVNSALYVGSPNLSLDASGQVNDSNTGRRINVANSADFQADLERERKNLQDDLEDFSFYPILTINVGYRF